MPRLLATDPALPALLASQDGLITRVQAEQLGLTRGGLDHRVERGRWIRLLPGVFLTTPADPTRRQRVAAARMWAGEEALVDGPSACWWHGMRVGSYNDAVVDLVVPRTATARSRDFVRVRQSQRRPLSRRSADGPYVDLAVALVVTAAQLPRLRASALLHEGVQREKVSVDSLSAAMAVAPPRHSSMIWDILGDLGAGTRSAPEADFRRLVQSSVVLPEPLWNPLLRLPDGTLVSPDALWIDAGLVHEVNGVLYHAWAEQFEDMQARHDIMTAAGLTLLHNPPRRIWRHPHQVLSLVEQCYRRQTGRGMPDGITLVSPESAADFPG